MAELRWALIGFALVFLLGLALWEWRRVRGLPSRSTMVEPQAPDITLITERPRRLEPGLSDVPDLHAAHDEGLEIPTILPVESLRVAVETAVDIPAAARGITGDALLMNRPAASHHEADSTEVAPAGTATTATRPVIRWPPPAAERVLTLRVVKPGGDHLAGRALRIALESAGLECGPQSIYHRADPEGAVIVSAANLVQPGTLDPEHMDGMEFRGLSLFSVLPGPLPPVRMLEELVATARSVAHRLGAIVQDEGGEDLDGPRLTALRRSLP